MSGLTKDAIIKANDLKREEVDVTECGIDGEIIIRSLTAKERSLLELKYEALRKSEKPITVMEILASIVVMGAINQDGSKLFTEEEIPILMSKNGNLIEKLAYRVQVLSGIMKEEVKSKAKN